MIDLTRLIICTGDGGVVASYSAPVTTDAGEVLWISSRAPLDVAGWQRLADSALAAPSPDKQESPIKVEAEDGYIIGA